MLVNDPLSLDEAQIGGWNEYGLDEDAPVPDVDENAINNVIVPETRVTFCEIHKRHFAERINPLVNDENEGITLFNDALILANQYLTYDCCTID